MKRIKTTSELSKKLKVLRETNRYSQKEIANLLDFSQAKYNYFESGKYAPDINSLKKLAELYNISLNELLEEKAIIRVKSTLSISEAPAIQPSANNSIKDQEKLITLYEKRIAELEEKCSRKDQKIVALKLILETFNKDLRQVNG